MKLKNVLFGGLAITTVMLASCSEEEKNTDVETVKVSTLNANKEVTEIDVPLNPERVCILDLAALDIIDVIGKGDTVVGAPTLSIEYLEGYDPENNSNILNVGTIKEADMEAVFECAPDVIFIGGRLAASYDELNAIAPTVYLATDTEIGVYQSTINNAMQIAKIFDATDMINDTVTQYTSTINSIKAVSEGKNAIVSMFVGNSANVLTNTGRCSIIGVECGFTNVGDSDSSNSSHGDTASWEYYLNVNPDYIFVMNRNEITGVSTSAKDTFNSNAIIQQTNAYKNNQIIFLEHSSVWYTAEGGINALGVMLNDLVTGLGIE